VDGVGVAGGGRPYLVRQPAGYLEYQLPVSLKAVIVWKGRVPLLQNERDEWELPGGKLELGEDPRSCLAREIEEELGWPAAVGSPLHSWVYEIRPDRHVFVLTYLATYDGDTEPIYSHEHKALQLVPLDEIDSLTMPTPYKDAIRLAVAQT
jgi:8-oxo-dGTP pyrophosphatase MutT (NUDIX family)